MFSSTLQLDLPMCRGFLVIGDVTVCCPVFTIWGEKSNPTFVSRNFASFTDGNRVVKDESCCLATSPNLTHIRGVKMDDVVYQRSKAWVVE